MIKINLIPPEMRRAAGPGVKLDELPWKQMGIGLGVLIFLYTLHILWAAHSQGSALARLSSEWETLQPQKAKVDETRAKLTAMENRTVILQGVKAPEHQWARRLNLLSDSLVADLWFTSFGFRSVWGGEATSMLSADFKGLIPTEELAPLDAIDPTTGLPMAAPESRPMATLSGSTLISGDRQAPVTRFLQKLKEHPEFSRWFEKVEIKDVSHRQVDRYEVSDFVILLYPRGGVS